MLAVRLHQEGLKVERIETPSPRPGEVLVRVHAAAITRDELEWLADRLPAIPSYEASGVVVDTGEEVYALTPFDQDVPGLAGVTVATGEGFSLSLDRARGGLIARERLSADVDERSWQVLGASRGEGGILGEGVRQALLRDPTYGPALGVARRLSG